MNQCGSEFCSKHVDRLQNYSVQAQTLLFSLSTKTHSSNRLLLQNKIPSWSSPDTQYNSISLCLSLCCCIFIFHPVVSRAFTVLTLNTNTGEALKAYCSWAFLKTTVPLKTSLKVLRWSLVGGRKSVVFQAAGCDGEAEKAINRNGFVYSNGRWVGVGWGGLSLRQGILLPLNWNVMRGLILRSHCAPAPITALSAFTLEE